MEKKVTSGVMLSLLLMSTLTLAVNVPSPKAEPYETRLHVRESPPGSWILGVPVGGWVWLTVDIESPLASDNTTNGIVGWTFSVKVDPDVLEVNNAYAATLGYFLFDFIDWNYAGLGHDPVILIEEINPTTGVIRGIGELIFGFEMLGVGAGGSSGPDWYGETYGLCRLRFKSKNETAYTRIDLCDAFWVDLNGTKHAFDVVDDGHYNEPPTPTAPTPPAENTNSNISDAEAFPLWVLGTAAAVVIGIAVAATFLWKRRK